MSCNKKWLNEAMDSSVQGKVELSKDFDVFPVFGKYLATNDLHGAADADAQSSVFYRAACHRNLLPTVFLQVARRKTGRRIECRATMVCRQPDNGMAPAATGKIGLQFIFHSQNQNRIGFVGFSKMGKYDVARVVQP